MLKVQEVTVFKMEYKGKEYPIIEAVVLIDKDDTPSTEHFASEELADRILDEDGNPKDRLDAITDECIYAYVPHHLHEKSEEEIADWIEKNLD